MASETGRKQKKYRGSTGEVPAEIVRMIQVIDVELKRIDIQKRLSLRHQDYFRENYLIPALEWGFIEMTLPDKPRSSKQRYRLTEKGKELKEQLPKKKK